MKNFSLKALGAFIFAAGLVVAGVAAPAYAVGVVTSPSVYSTGAVSGSTNPNPITISMTATTAGQSESVYIVFPTGWSWVTPNPSTTPASGCSSWSGASAWVSSATNLTPRLQCEVNTNLRFPNNASLMLNAFGPSTVPLASGVQVQIVIPANAVNVGQGTDFELIFGTSSTSTVDQSTVAITDSPAPSPSPASASAELTINASTGQLVAGSSVAVVASGLQASAPYTVVVQSTPQTLSPAGATATNGAVNTSVTLPSGLEAGWHSLTFSSTAADGSAMTSVAYFKVSASGTLLATSTTIPAELANTGVDSTSAILLLAGGLSLALVGAEMFLIARRKRSN